MMYQNVLTLLATILAGFALTNLPASTFLSAGVLTFFTNVGGIVIIVFSIALIVIGVKELLRISR